MNIFKIPPVEQRKAPVYPLRFLPQGYLVFYWLPENYLSIDKIYILKKYFDAIAAFTLLAAICAVSITTLYDQYGLFAGLYKQSEAQNLFEFYNYLISYSGPPTIIIFAFYYYWVYRVTGTLKNEFYIKPEHINWQDSYHKADHKFMGFLAHVFAPAAGMYMSYYPHESKGLFLQSEIVAYSEPNFDKISFIFFYAFIVFYVHVLYLMILFMFAGKFFQIFNSKKNKAKKKIR